MPLGFGDGAQAAEFLERAFELFGLDGLEQVIDGVGFEGAQGMLIVGRGEDYEGLDGQTREEFEAVDARHLDVEEEHVDRCVEDVERRDGCSGIRRGADDLELREMREQSPQAFDGEGFVVDKVGAQRRRIGHCASPDPSPMGMRMVTTVLFSIRLTVSCADFAEEKLEAADEIGKTVIGEIFGERESWTIIGDGEFADCHRAIAA